jgi:hypothetical protein
MRLVHRVVLIVVCLSCVLRTQVVNASMKLSVDATQVGRRILHIKMNIPVTPGPLTLAYPEWIPGQHAPVGPINDIVGLMFTMSGAAVPWQRDNVDLNTFHLQVPSGADELEAELYLVGASDESGFLLGNSSAPQQIILDWDQVVLYTLGPPAKTEPFRRSSHCRRHGSSAQRCRWSQRKDG